MAIKILIGGSPCTHWSIAQKNNRETEPEGIGWELFKNYVIAKEKFKPDYFLYENNKSAAPHIKEQIERELNTPLMYINSALVSAQNRQRFYVFNWDVDMPEDRGIKLKDILVGGTMDREKARCLLASQGRTTEREFFKKNQGTMSAERVTEYGNPDKSRPLISGYCRKGDGEGSLEGECFGNGNPNKQVFDYVSEPVNATETDKSQTIKAQYQNTSVANMVCYHSTYGATGVAEPINTADGGDKSRTLMAGYYKYGTATLITNDSFKGGTTAVGEPVGIGEMPEHNGKYRNGKQVSQQYRVFSPEGVSPAVCTCNNPNIPERVGDMPNSYGHISHSQGGRLYSTDGKSVCLTSFGGGMGAKTGLYAVPVEQDYPVYAYPTQWDENGIPTYAISYADGKEHKVYKVTDGKVTIKGKEYPIKLDDGYYIFRKLTITECCRLQTLPDDYCKAVSISQGYKGLGNGWTAEVIIHILNGVLKDVPRDEEIVVLSMYDGIGTGRYCLDKMGFTNVKYYAYEIDKYAIMVANDNYPDIMQCGDAFQVREDTWAPPQTTSEWVNSLLNI